MLRSALCLILATLCSTAVWAKNDNECDDALATTLDLPPKWGFPPGEFLKLRKAFPDLAPYLKSLSQLAHFVDAPANAELFDYLGAYANVGLAGELHPDHTRDHYDHRLTQIAIVLQFASRRGLYPAQVRTEQASFLALALGPLAPQIAFDPVGFMKDHDGSALRAFVVRQRDRIPNLRTFLDHSEGARVAMVTGLLDMGPKSVTFEALLAKLKARLKGARGFETADEARVLDMIEIFADRDAARFASSYGQGQIKKNQARQMIEAPQETFLLLCFTILFGLTEEKIKGASESLNGLVSNPIGLLVYFDRIIEADTLSDRGLNPLFRRAFIETVLHQRTLTGPQVRQLARAELERLLSPVREVWRQWRKDAALNTAGPSRDERLRGYAAQLRERAGASRLNGPALTLVESPEATELAPPPIDPWDDLLDAARPLADARAKVRSALAPDSTYSLSLRRTGFRYRVEFSARLLGQWLDPAAGEPEDVRTWLEALQFGPARDLRQRGWKKLATRYRGLYDWEIKILNSPYRVLGYKKADGIWRFEFVEMTH